MKNKTKAAPSMSRVFGVCMLSLPAFYDTLVGLTDKITIVKHTQDKNVTGIALVPSFGVFVNKIHLLQSAKAVVIFDTPLLLQQVTGITILDAVLGQFIHSWRITFQTNVKEMASTVYKASKKNYDFVELTQIDVLPKVIEQVKDSYMLDKYLAAMYALTHNKRVTFTKLFIEYMLGYLTKKEFDKQFAKIAPSRGKGIDIVQELFDYMHHSKNAGYFAAFNEIGRIWLENQKAGVGSIGKDGKPVKAKKKPISYDKLSKKYSVDSYEIIYLIKSYRKLARTRVTKQTIDEYYTAIGGK